MRCDRVVAYITGAGRGLGRATALRLAASGARVSLADISLEALQEVKHLIGDKALINQVDVTDEVQVKESMLATVKAMGELNLCVSCAGIAPPAKILSKKGVHSLSAFAKVMQINTVGTFNVSRLAAECMAKNETTLIDGESRGVIINTASIAAFDGQIGQVAYAASKGAVASMTLPMARDLASHGIRVCTIAPGLFMTPMMAGLPEKVQTDLAATVPFPKRLGDPDEYAKLVLAILENPMLNGEVIRLDGALRLPP